MGQDSSIVKKKVIVGAGTVYSIHQDNRYSAVQHRGIGTAANIGSSRETKKRISSTQLILQTTKEYPSTFREDVFSKNYHFSLFYRYLHKLSPTYSIGGRMELINGYTRQTEGLFNNANNYLIGNSWYVAGHLKKRVGKNIMLNAFLDFNLFSVQKGTTGFGFSSPHNIIENGQFNYQDEFESPTKVKGYAVEPFWTSLAIKTSLIASYKTKISIGYHWRIRRFTATKKYPIYSVSHSVVVYYTIFNKKKAR